MTGCRELGENSVPVPIDVSDQKTIYAWVLHTLSNSHSSEMPGPVNHAGAGHLGGKEEMTLEQWHAMIELNANGLYHLLQTNWNGLYAIQKLLYWLLTNMIKMLGAFLDVQIHGPRETLFDKYIQDWGDCKGRARCGAGHIPIIEGFNQPKNGR